jgi:hypothetical protein
MMDTIQARPMNQATNAPIQYHTLAHLLCLPLVMPKFYLGLQPSC